MLSPATGENRDPAAVITQDQQYSSKSSTQGRLAQIRVDTVRDFCKRLFLYDFLTGKDLGPKALGVGGNYASLLDDSRYVVAANPIKI